MKPNEIRATFSNIDSDNDDSAIRLLVELTAQLAEIAEVLQGIRDDLPGTES